VLFLAIQKFIRFDLRKSEMMIFTISDKHIIFNKLLNYFDNFLVLQNRKHVYTVWKTKHFSNTKDYGKKNFIYIDLQWIYLKKKRWKLSWHRT
jgi:hypothetical protein